VAGAWSCISTPRFHVGFSRGKAAEADNSYQSSSDVKNAWSCISTPHLHMDFSGCKAQEREADHSSQSIIEFKNA